MDSQILDDFSKECAVAWEGPLARGQGSFPDSRQSGSVSGCISCVAFPGNWSGYRSLQFSLYCPWERVAIGGLDLYDGEALHSPFLEYGDYLGHDRSLMIGPGVTHVVLRIEGVRTNRGDRTLDLGHMEKLAFVMPEPEAGERPVAMAGLRLSGEAGGPDRLACARPGDTVILIEQLDIKCFTYEPEKFVDPEDVAALAGELRGEIEALEDAVRIAETCGKQTYYYRATLVAADVARTGRPMLAWHFSPWAKRKNLSEALALVFADREKLTALLSSRLHEDDEDDSNLAISRVKPVPDLGALSIDENKFVDSAGNPVLVCAMSYHNEGTLLDFFAPERHKLEIYAVGGGSRYDVEWSPVYRAFHQYPNTARVGWQGWCGHLIKDQWSMGGRKENVVLCLENERLLEAIDAYNRGFAREWTGLPGLMYVILAYELSYICYCEESLRRFRLWLEQRHGDIGTLNTIWGTAYRSFDEAVPPATAGHGPAPDANRAAWYDWADWNMRRFTDHLVWSRESIKRIRPGIPLCAGGTHSMLHPSLGVSGIDEELIINEVDDVILHEGNDLLGIDLFHALSSAPKPLVDPEQGGICDRWMLNYLHGKSAISMFWWPRQPSRQFPRSTLVSPMHGTMPIPKITEHLTTALDVRRLNVEITAFWDIPKEVAILYSRTSMMQIAPGLACGNRTPFLDGLRNSYEAARYLDAGLTFISERQALAGKAAKFKLMIVPAVHALPASVFEALDAFVLGGGCAVVLPESFTMDEYARPAGYLGRWGMHIVSSSTPGVEGLGGMNQRYDQSFERAVAFGQGTRMKAVRFHGDIRPFELVTDGVFQHIQAERGTISAVTAEGEPILFHIPRGNGEIWYLAGMPTRPSLMHLLDLLCERAGVHRPMRVCGSGGQRVPGLEARLAVREFDDLVYLSNECGADVTYRIETSRPWDRIRELRSMDWQDGPTGVIRNNQVLLFSFQRNPGITGGKR